MSNAENLQRLVSSAVQWGPWAAAGMASKQKNLLQKLEKLGFGTVTPVEGLRCLTYLVSSVGRQMEPCIAACPLAWSILLRRFKTPFLESFETTKESVSNETPSKSEGAKLQPVRSDIEAKVVAVIKGVLSSDILLNQPLMEVSGIIAFDVLSR